METGLEAISVMLWQITCLYFVHTLRLQGGGFKQDGIFTLAEGTLGKHGMGAVAQVSLAALSQAYSRTRRKKQSEVWT